MAEEVDSLTINVAGKVGDYITADSFLGVVREAVAILRDLDPSQTLVWKLKDASINSPLSMTFVAEPRPDVQDWRSDVSRRYMNTFSRLDRGDTSPGEDVPEKVFLRAKRLVDVLNNGVTKITFSSPGMNPVTPTQRIQATVGEFVEARRNEYTDHATLEGDLRTVTIQGGSGFFIYDRLTNQRTRCDIPHEQLQLAKDAMERRVSVTGLTHYKAGKPIDIKVDPNGLEVLPLQEDLPQFADIKGIDLTGGVDSVEFVRRQRDGW